MNLVLFNRTINMQITILQTVLLEGAVEFLGPNAKTERMRSTGGIDIDVLFESFIWILVPSSFILILVPSQNPKKETIMNGYPVCQTCMCHNVYHRAIHFNRKTLIGSIFVDVGAYFTQKKQFFCTASSRHMISQKVIL